MLNILEKIRLHNLENIKKLYEEYDRINKKMMVIQNNYLTGNEILCKLNKKYVLSEIKEYIESTTEYELLFEEHNAAIEQTLDFEYSIIEKIEEIVVNEKEFDANITSKVNRQSKVKTRSKRQIVRKGD